MKGNKKKYNISRRNINKTKNGILISFCIEGVAGYKKKRKSDNFLGNISMTQLSDKVVN